MGVTNREGRERLTDVWRRVLDLSWPVALENVFRTLMRTTDIVVVGLFSPAAIAAVGLADLYARLPLRVGLGLGGGAIALSSQDTGRDAAASRAEAIGGALLLGVLAGVPLASVGLIAGRELIALLGAGPTVAGIGGTYLTLILASAPARHVALIGARALQGTGDTRTPMYVNIVINLLNAVGSVGLAIGAGLGVVGVGIATLTANYLSAGLLVAAIRHPTTEAGLARPRDPTVFRQLLAVGLPRVGEGLVSAAAMFPFNAVLLGLGTEVNAAYQVGRRLYQQVTAPLARAYNVAASVLVGQRLGEGDPAAARREGWSVTLLGAVTVGGLGLGLALLAGPLAGLITADPLTQRLAADFARTFGVAAVALVTFNALSGALQGGSDTRTPFLARTTGTVGVLLGGAVLLAVQFDYGVLGVLVAIAASYVWMAGVVGVGFARGNWADRATRMMAERSADAVRTADERDGPDPERDDRPLTED